MPDPQNVTEGIKRIAIAIFRFISGNSWQNNLNIFHIPINEIDAKRIVVGKYKNKPKGVSKEEYLTTEKVFKSPTK